MDSHVRSIVKAISWRVFGTIITTFVAWAITGQAGMGALIGLVDTTIKIGVYYGHERAWNRVNFGRAEPPDYEI